MNFPWEFVPVILLVIASLLVPVSLKAQDIHDRQHLRKLHTWLKTTPSKPGRSGESRTASIIDHLAKRRLSDDEWDALFCALDEVTECYLRSSTVARESIREAIFSDRRMAKIFLKYARLPALKLNGNFETEVNFEILKKGIAAVSIENFRTEWRYSSLALEKLAKSSLKIGLDPEPAFEEIRGISSGRSPYPEIEDHPSMQSFLRAYSKERPLPLDSQDPETFACDSATKSLADAQGSPLWLRLIQVPVGLVLGAFVIFSAFVAVLLVLSHDSIASVLGGVIVLVFCFCVA